MPPPLDRIVLLVLLILPAVPASGDPASWVQWDRATERQVSAARDKGAACPRAHQLSNGEILLVYHHGESYGDYGSRVTMRKSRDGGLTWYQTQEIDGPKERGFWGFGNPDFIELGGGRLLLVSAARGKAEPGSRDAFLSECQRSGLRVRFSDNYGSSWGPPRMIAAGRGRVWEPSVVRLPSGELQIFYAIESPALMAAGGSQGIESIRSLDGGQTWSAPTVVSQQAGCRNGVPATLALSNGHVLCGQEVVGLETSPWIADTFHGQTRGYHLAQDRYEFGGAPFLTRAADGSTLLIFHSQCHQTAYLKRMTGSWLFSDIFVQRGDAEGNGFGPASCPWPTVEGLTGAFFPSLLVMKDGTLAALASFITVRPDRTSSTVVRWIKGRMTAPAARNASAGAAPEKQSVITTSGEAPPAPSRHEAPEYRYGPPPDEEIR